MPRSPNGRFGSGSSANAFYNECRIDSYSGTPESQTPPNCSSPLHNQQMIANDILRHLVDLQEADKLRKPKESLSAMQLLRKPQSLAYMWPTLAQLRWPKSAGPDLLNKIGNQHALTYVQGDKYYGAKANINAWEPKIQLSNEFSLSQSWILAGSLDGDLNSIEAGWQSDVYQAGGCYNLLFSRFIQINSKIAMGASISPISKFQSSQYDISIMI